MSNLPNQQTPNDFPFKHSGQDDAFGNSQGGNVASIQGDFDARAIFNQEQINAMLAAFASNDGARQVIMDAVAGVVSAGATVQQAVESLKTLIDGATAGSLPDRSVQAIKIALNTLTEDEMSAAYKKQAGGVAEFDTVATNTGNITTNTTNLNILRTAKESTGSASSYIVNTDGTFDRTVDGNTLSFIANHTNTGVSTLSEDSQTAKFIKKPDDAGGLVDLEAGDITEGNVVTVYRRITGDFFLLAPKGGKNPLKDWKNTTSKYNVGQASIVTSLISSVTGSGWIVSIGCISTPTDFALDVDGSPYIGDNANDIAAEIDGSTSCMIRYETGFDYYSEGAGRNVVFYVEGDVFEEGVLKAIVDTSANTASLTAINVTGEGWFYGGYNRGNGLTLVIDSVNIVVDKSMRFFNSLVKFNSSLQVDTDADNRVWFTYTLLP